MTNSELRAVALSLRQRMATMHDDILPAWNEITTWELDGDDLALPTIGAVKAVLTAFEDFSKPPLLLYEELRALRATTDEEATLPESFSFESVAWENVLEKPSTFAPSAHSHVKTDISDFPSTMTPSAHSHAFSEITDKPTAFPAKIELIAYIGDGAASKVLALSGAFTPKAGVISNLNTANGLVCWNGVHFSNVSSSSLTIDNSMNNSGSNYRLILWG